MIKNSHYKFLRWAVWMNSPLATAGCCPAGYGSTITAKILEGKGTILPGPPKGSGPRVHDVDRVATAIDGFICKQLDKTERRLIKVFYLTRNATATEKANKLRIAERTMFDHLHKIHVKLENHLQAVNPRDRM
jgi:hypothetical protein